MRRDKRQIWDTVAKLRKDGYTQKAIAQHLGYTRDWIKTICCELGIRREGTIRREVGTNSNCAEGLTSIK